MIRERLVNKPIINEENPPRFIAIEGPIGVGKTTLTRKLAERLNFGLLLEQAEDNPFLPSFYANQRHAALSTQLFFLLQRAQQLNELTEDDLFNRTTIADFLFQKDPLFARATLDKDELELYNKVYEKLEVDMPTPDLVIYLQAPIKVLKDRIQQRGIKHERHIDLDYLERINAAYTEFFLDYTEAPLLIINATEIDFANNDSHFEQLLQYLLEINGGRHYFNPSFSIV
ncbi:deoxynucleoside kinase [Spongiibacter sp. KMU-158]|uniref:Deoxynucleoside kinase n=1 Tax=Spongiibacter pelagi TaxID=2760804 RepID=A0A927C5Y5_9GAMM|nr:deoxynucleoside kinase [Spongiibacter pelagi]MBD2860005.1 deoxynucleoside kinase [Spongiibacter pelagi]